MTFPKINKSLVTNISKYLFKCIYSLTCLSRSPKGLSQTDHYRQVTTISRFSKFSVCVTNMFDNRPFSFHSLNDRQSKIRLHAVNDTTTAKIYKKNLFTLL